MSAVADKIIKRVRGKGRGWAFTPKDFLDLGTRASIDMALTRLVRVFDGRRRRRDAIAIAETARAASEAVQQPYSTQCGIWK